jgi:hypothetical protein
MAVLSEFFMWMTIINALIIVLTAVLFLLLKDVAVRIHGKMFGISPEAISIALYGYLGVFKVVFIVFNLVPWLALKIIS